MRSFDDTPPQIICVDVEVVVFVITHIINRTGFIENIQINEHLHNRHNQPLMRQSQFSQDRLLARQESSTFFHHLVNLSHLSNKSHGLSDFLYTN